jgi:hypothetical protein
LPAGAALAIVGRVIRRAGFRQFGQQFEDSQKPKRRTAFPSSTLTLARNHAANFHPLPAHRQIRAIPRLHLAHNGPPARRARLPFMPDEQVLDHPVELRMFITA